MGQVRRGLAAGLAVGLATVAIALMSCSSTTSSPQGGDEITRANFLIDQKQYSEAIYILGDRIKKQPGDTRARVLLASAYAGRAGIKLSSYTDFASELEKWSKIDELLSPEDDSSLIQTVGKAALRIQVIIKAFDALPSSGGPEALSDLVAALDTLDQAGKLQGGASLYRGLLRVVIFKQNLRTSYRPRLLAGCKISTADLTAWLRAVGQDVEKIVNDVANGVANEETRAHTQQFGARLHASIGDVVNAQPTAGLSIDLPVALRKVYGACE